MIVWVGVKWRCVYSLQVDEYFNYIRFDVHLGGWTFIEVSKIYLVYLYKLISYLFLKKHVRKNIQQQSV